MQLTSSQYRDLPGYKLYALALKERSGPFFVKIEEDFDEIVSLIVTCFPECSHLAQYLKDCLPIYINRLKMFLRGELVTFSCIAEIASNVGYWNIQNLKRDDVIRLFFSSGLVVLNFLAAVCEVEHQRGESRTLISDFNCFSDYSQNYSNGSLTSSKPRFPTDNIDALEKDKLIIFANFMQRSLDFYSNPRGKRTQLLRICAHLCEGPKEYVSGTGMTCETRRRVTIFEELSGVVPISTKSEDYKGFSHGNSNRPNDAISSSSSFQNAVKNKNISKLKAKREFAEAINIGNSEEFLKRMDGIISSHIDDAIVHSTVHNFERDGIRLSGTEYRLDDSSVIRSFVLEKPSPDGSVCEIGRVVTNAFLDLPDNNDVQHSDMNRNDGLGNFDDETMGDMLDGLINSLSSEDGVNISESSAPCDGNFIARSVSVVKTYNKDQIDGILNDPSFDSMIYGLDRTNSVPLQRLFSIDTFIREQSSQNSIDNQASALNARIELEDLSQSTLPPDEFLDDNRFIFRGVSLNESSADMEEIIKGDSTPASKRQRLS